MIVPHWSASRFMLWDQCPGAFKARYVDEQPFEMTEAVAFGSAVHQGLEAHYRGEDGQRAYRAAWRTLAQQHGLDVDPSLTGVGLELMDQAMELGLVGDPERAFNIDTSVELKAPLVGAIDLWGADGTVYDFKTTRGLWSQERAQQETWQPSLYSWARWLEEPSYTGAFEYIVMNRVTGTLQRFRREWTTDEVVAAWNVAMLRMQVIAAAVEADQYECHGKHGYCPECGDRWGHDHVCYPDPRRVRSHVVQSVE